MSWLQLIILLVVEMLLKIIINIKAIRAANNNKDGAYAELIKSELRVSIKQY
jgi:hypothetical protein